MVNVSPMQNFFAKYIYIYIYIFELSKWLHNFHTIKSLLFKRENHFRNKHVQWYCDKYIISTVWYRKTPLRLVDNKLATLKLIDCKWLTFKIILWLPHSKKYANTDDKHHSNNRWSDNDDGSSSFLSLLSWENPKASR